MLGPLDDSWACVGRKYEDGAPPCEVELPAPPAGESLDPDLVEFWFTTPSGWTEQIPCLETADDCATAQHGGWHAEEDGNTLAVRVCPCTCAQLGQEPWGTLGVLVGCVSLGSPTAG